MVNYLQINRIIESPKQITVETAKSQTGRIQFQDGFDYIDKRPQKKKTLSQNHETSKQKAETGSWMINRVSQLRLNPVQINHWDDKVVVPAETGGRNF